MGITIAMLKEYESELIWNKESSMRKSILELSDKKLKEHNLNRSKIIEKILLGVATNKIPLEMILEY